MDNSNIIEWGEIVNTHGVKGELKVMPFVEFKKLSKQVKSLNIGSKSYNIVGVREHKNMILLTLEGVDTMDKAEALRGKVLTTSRDAVDLGEGHYFYSDIYGFEVYDERTEQVIGILDRIESFPGSDVYVIKTEEGREIMIPMVDAFDRGVDLEEECVYVETIGGMLEDDED
ncbi:MAG: 16S rRNA processing protein RimM [Clostridia bacterium]|nr:16S rRNA processing protein RimM [Clostridia bacterium]